MTPEQTALLQKAERSLKAAKQLKVEGLSEFSVQEHPANKDLSE